MSVKLVTEMKLKYKNTILTLHETVSFISFSGPISDRRDLERRMPYR